MENRNTTSESSIEKYFVQKCKEHGMKAIKMIPTFEAGIPDRGVLHNGMFGFAEIKATGQKPRLNQVLYMQALRQQGFFVGVIDSCEEADSWIAEFLQFRTPSRYCPCCGYRLAATKSLCVQCDFDIDSPSA